MSSIMMRAYYKRGPPFAIGLFKSLMTNDMLTKLFCDRMLWVDFLFEAVPEMMEVILTKYPSWPNMPSAVDSQEALDLFTNLFSK